MDKNMDMNNFDFDSLSEEFHVDDVIGNYRVVDVLRRLVHRNRLSTDDFVTITLRCMDCGQEHEVSDLYLRTVKDNYFCNHWGYVPEDCKDLATWRSIVAKWKSMVSVTRKNAESGRTDKDFSIVKEWYDPDNPDKRHMREIMNYYRYITFLLKGNPPAKSRVLRVDDKKPYGPDNVRIIL